MNIKNNKIHTMKDAPKLTPKPLSRNFLAALLKRAGDKTDFIHKSAIEDRIKAEKEMAKSNAERSLASMRLELAELRKAISDFNKASGIDLNTYRYNFAPTQIGEIVRLIEAGGTQAFEKNLVKLEVIAKSICEGISKGLEALKQYEQQVKVQEDGHG